jgi:hypothetical protein
MSRHRRHRGRRRLRDLARVEPEPEAQAELDRLGPSADAAAASAAAAVRRPPKLIVETPERVAARQARDLRDGVKKADRRSLLYVAIGVLVAMVVVGILALIDARGGF